MFRENLDRISQVMAGRRKECLKRHTENQVGLKGASWETEVDWLLGNDVEIELVLRFF